MKRGVVNLADGGTRTPRVSHAVRRTNQGVFVLQTSCASLGTLGKFSLSKWSMVGGGLFSYTSHIGKPFGHDLGSTSVVVNVNYGRQTKRRAQLGKSTGTPGYLVLLKVKGRSSTRWLQPPRKEN